MDDSDKTRRNLVAASTVVIVVFFLGVESFSFSGLKVEFGTDTYRPWFVMVVVMFYFLFRYTSNPEFFKKTKEAKEQAEDETAEVSILFYCGKYSFGFNRKGLENLPMLNLYQEQSFLRDKKEYYYSKVESAKTAYLITQVRHLYQKEQRDIRNKLIMYNFPTRVFLRSLGFVFYGKSLWNFLEIYVPVILGITALVITLCKFVDIAGIL